LVTHSPEVIIFFSGGYELGISRQVKFLPSLLIKYHPHNVVQIDYNAQMNLKDRVWLGIGYRNRNMLVGMLQCQNKLSTQNGIFI